MSLRTKLKNGKVFYIDRISVASTKTQCYVCLTLVSSLSGQKSVFVNYSYFTIQLCWLMCVQLCTRVCRLEGKQSCEVSMEKTVWLLIALVS